MPQRRSLSGGLFGSYRLRGVISQKLALQKGRTRVPFLTVPADHCRLLACATPHECASIMATVPLTQVAPYRLVYSNIL